MEEQKENKKCLVLFSGTRSFEKVFEKDYECRGVDLDNTFKPFYNVNILEWNYKEDLKDWIPDFIHGSPVCKNYTPLKNHIRSRGLNDDDLEFSHSLVNKTLEIIEYFKTLNPKLKFTIENPRGAMRKLDVMKKYKRVTTSYCRYGFKYSKTTDFWYGGFDLVLESFCSSKNKCKTSLVNEGIHPVRIGYSSGGVQEIDSKYFRRLRKTNDKYKGFTDTYFRYRIPEKLIKDIYNCVN